MSRNFRSLLKPKKIDFLKRKLEAGEITPEECKEVLTFLMLKEYEQVRFRRLREVADGISKVLKGPRLRRIQRMFGIKNRRLSSIDMVKFFDEHSAQNLSISSSHRPKFEQHASPIAH